MKIYWQSEAILKNNIEHLTKNKQYVKSELQENQVLSPAREGLTKVLQELKDVHQSIDAVMKNFRVYRMPYQRHEAIIEEMVIMAEEKKLLTNVEGVVAALQNRERKGGLGIPGTGMALFHCRHENVHELIFQIAHLDEPSLVKGMDGKDMYIKSLLLMLAPEELSVKEQEIVSLLSTSIIESNEAIMIFSSSNEEMIRTKLEAIFLDYLHTNLIRD